MLLLLKKVRTPGLLEPAVRTASAHPASTDDFQRRLVYLVLALGVMLRLIHYFHNRSFVTDELYLGVNVVQKGFWALATEPFEYEQKAPIGYLWVVKAVTLLFGNGEKALRLVPLLSGIGSLFVLVPVARYFLKSWTVVAAVAIMAFSSGCVFHSVEAKQYSTELFAAVLSLWLYIRFRDKTDAGSLLAWGVLGSVLLWFSFSLIFILASIGIAVSLDTVLRRQWRRMFQYAVPFSLWLLSFGIQYVLITSKYHQSGWLIDYFDRIDQAFIPLSASALGMAKWLAHKVYLTLLYPLNLLLDLDGEASMEPLKHHPIRHLIKMGWLHAACLVVGLAYFFRKDRLNFAVLLLPLLLALAASALRVYPFHERFTLFLMPALIIVVCLGLEHLQLLLARYKGVFAVLVTLFFAPTVVTAGMEVADRRMMHAEYNRDVLLYVNDHFREGDAVYVFWNMKQGYQYYKLTYPLKYTAVEGSFVKNISRSPADYLRNLQPDFDQFKGHQRLWFIYDNDSQTAIGDYVTLPEWYHRPGFKAPELLHNHFSGFGQRVGHFQRNRSTVDLYELKP
ncbi:hypothetical protein GCM10027048_43290 [Hymenobacter coalescens]